MIEFRTDKAIYLQIADRICDGILAGRYPENARVPSVREYAVMLGVNVNTAVKAFEVLARDTIIYNKRGLGFFVEAGARDRIIAARRREFRDEILPEVCRKMRLLGMDIGEVDRLWAESSDSDCSGSPAPDEAHPSGQSGT